MLSLLPSPWGVDSKSMEPYKLRGDLARLLVLLFIWLDVVPLITTELCQGQPSAKGATRCLIDRHRTSIRAFGSIRRE
jgi:hypothetical protein